MGHWAALVSTDRFAASPGSQQPNLSVREQVGKSRQHQEPNRQHGWLSKLWSFWIHSIIRHLVFRGPRRGP